MSPYTIFNLTKYKFSMNLQKVLIDVFYINDIIIASRELTAFIILFFNFILLFSSFETPEI